MSSQSTVCRSPLTELDPASAEWPEDRRRRRGGGGEEEEERRRRRGGEEEEEEEKKKKKKKKKDEGRRRRRVKRKNNTAVTVPATISERMAELSTRGAGLAVIGGHSLSGQLCIHIVTNSHQ